MQSAALDSVVKVLALDGGNLELLGRGLARAVGPGKGARAPGGAAVDLAQVGHLGKRLGVAEGHELDAVVGEGRHGGEGRRLLAAAEGAGRDEEAGLFAPVAAAGPDAAGFVPESLQIVVSTGLSFVSLALQFHFFRRDRAVGHAVC